MRQESQLCTLAGNKTHHMIDGGSREASKAMEFRKKSCLRKSMWDHDTQATWTVGVLESRDGDAAFEHSSQRLGAIQEIGTI